MKNILLLFVIVLLCSCSVTRHPAQAFDANAAHGKVYNQKVRPAAHPKDLSGNCKYKKHPGIFKIIL